MSSITWTPRAVASKTTVAATKLWRAVEAQHVASTLRLVDSPDEQIVLEELLDAAKPRLPTGAGKLHYLLSTPFRYPVFRGSRFRAATDPGVFYGAATIRTACAELGYWRWRFVQDSQGLNQLGPAPQTLFQVGVRARAVDLEKPPFTRNAKQWTDPEAYAATQEFGRVARDAGVGFIRYRSVRDPEPGRCAAVLQPDAFHPAKPVAPTQTWLLSVTREYAVWQRDQDAFHFDMQRWRRSPA